MNPLSLAAVVIVGALSSLAQDGAQVYEAWPFDATEAARRQAETAKAIAQPVDLKIPLPGKEGLTLNWKLIPAG